jgi:hypothetical protein
MFTTGQLGINFNGPLSGGHWVINITKRHFIHAGFERGLEFLFILTLKHQEGLGGAAQKAFKFLEKKEGFIDTSLIAIN